MKIIKRTDITEIRPRHRVEDNMHRLVHSMGAQLRQRFPNTFTQLMSEHRDMKVVVGKFLLANHTDLS